MSKLRIDQLEHILKTTLANVYLVTGDESLLVQEACDYIRSAARRDGFDERELHHTDGGFQWEHLFHTTNSMSLFCEKKIIEIRVHNGKPGDAGSKAIVEFCKNKNNDSLLLLVMPKIDKRSQSSKWFKAIDSHGSIITIWPVGPQQLPRWIKQRLTMAGLQADKDAIEILCSKVEGNLLAASQEIEKLTLLGNSATISAQMMADAVTDSARYDVFGLVDKALAGDSRGAVASLQGLRSEGSEPTLILWALSREIRVICAIRESLENGKSYEQSANRHNLWEKRKAIVKRAVYRLSLHQTHTLIRKSSNADKIIKGSVKGEIWNTLLDIVLSISGTHALDARSTKLGLQLAR